MQGHAIYFITPVWGSAYVRTYLDLVLPSQLSPNNLPARPEDQSRYLICTTADDAETIKKHPLYNRLQGIIPVDFFIIEGDIVVPHDTMSDCYRRGILAAARIDAASAFLTPDLVQADGNFKSIWRWVNEGKSVVFVTGIRTKKHGVTVDLKRSFLAPDGTIIIQPRDLVRVGLENLHANGRASFFSEGEGPLIPANLYWRAGNGGFVARCFHLHPIVVRPQQNNVVFRGTVDDDFVEVACPDATNDYVVSDSDEFMMIEVSDTARLILTTCRKRSVADVIGWAEQFANRRHRQLFATATMIHDEASDPAVWKHAETEAAVVGNEILKGLRLKAFQLLLKGPQGWSRLLRRNLNTNAEAQTFAGRIFGRFFLWAFQTYSWIVRILLSCSAIVNKFVCGTPGSPRYYSPLWRAYREINRAIETVVAGSTGDSAVVGNVESHIDRPLRSVMANFDDTLPCLVDPTTGDEIPNKSLALALVDRDLPDKLHLAIFLLAIRQALSESARLVIVNQNQQVWPSPHCPGMDSDVIASSLKAANFRITEQHWLNDRLAFADVQFSANLAAWDSWLRRKCRFYPIYAIVILTTVLPLWLLVRPIFDLGRIGADLVHSKGNGNQYFASVTVAEPYTVGARRRSLV